MEYERQLRYSRNRFASRSPSKQHPHRAFSAYGQRMQALRPRSASIRARRQPVYRGDRPRSVGRNDCSGRSAGPSRDQQQEKKNHSVKGWGKLGDGGKVGSDR
ncbi:hypothetical protein A2U01_0050049, partial [Trifolium medium]|nr:hypothetical protein [Trifolium medium]